MTLQSYIKLAESATDGPWEWDSKPWDYDREEEAPWLVSIPDPYHVIIAVHSGDTVSEPDAQFIAASRTLGPAMAKALIEAEGALEMSLSVIRGYRQYSEGAASQQYPGEHKIEQALSQIQALNGGEDDKQR